MMSVRRTATLFRFSIRTTVVSAVAAMAVLAGQTPPAFAAPDTAPATMTLEAVGAEVAPLLHSTQAQLFVANFRAAMPSSAVDALTRMGSVIKNGGSAEEFANDAAVVRSAVAALPAAKLETLETSARPLATALGALESPEVGGTERICLTCGLSAIGKLFVDSVGLVTTLGIVLTITILAEGACAAIGVANPVAGVACLIVVNGAAILLTLGILLYQVPVIARDISDIIPRFQEYGKCPIPGLPGALCIL